MTTPFDAAALALATDRARDPHSTAIPELERAVVLAYCAELYAKRPNFRVYAGMDGPQVRYRGVNYDASRKAGKPWKASLKVGAQTINSARYGNQIDAAKAYDRLVAEHRPGAPVNFADETERPTRR